MTEFGNLGPEGYTHTRTIKQEDLRACPHFILVPEHYDERGRCYCYDREHVVMREWGYTWSEQEGRWVA